VRLAVVPFEPGRRDRPAQDRLSERDAGQRDRIEARERVKRVALDAGPFDRGVQKQQVEEGIVADEYRALAIVILDFFAYAWKESA